MLIANRNSFVFLRQKSAKNSFFADGFAPNVALGWPSHRWKNGSVHCNLSPYLSCDNNHSLRLLCSLFMVYYTNKCALTHGYAIREQIAERWLARFVCECAPWFGVRFLGIWYGDDVTYVSRITLHIWCVCACMREFNNSFEFYQQNRVNMHAK